MGNTAVVGDGKYNRGWEIQWDIGNTVGDGKYNPEWELQSEMGNTVGMENTVRDGQ